MDKVTRIVLVLLAVLVLASVVFADTLFHAQKGIIFEIRNRDGVVVQDSVVYLSKPVLIPNERSTPEQIEKLIKAAGTDSTIVVDLKHTDSPVRRKHAGKPAVKPEPKEEPLSDLDLWEP